MGYTCNIWHQFCIFSLKIHIKHEKNNIILVNKEYLNRPDIVGLYAYNLMKKNKLEEAKEILERGITEDPICKYPFVTGYADLSGLDIVEASKRIKFKY